MNYIKFEIKNMSQNRLREFKIFNIYCFTVDVIYQFKSPAKKISEN